MFDLIEVLKSAPWLGGALGLLGVFSGWCINRRSRNAATLRDEAQAEKDRVATEQIQFENNKKLWDQITALQEQLAAMRAKHEAELQAAETRHNAELEARDRLHAAEIEAIQKLHAAEIVAWERIRKVLEDEAVLWTSQRTEILRRLSECEQRGGVGVSGS